MDPALALLSLLDIVRKGRLGSNFKIEFRMRSSASKMKNHLITASNISSDYFGLQSN